MKYIVIASIVLALICDVAKIGVESAFSTSGIAYGQIEANIQSLQTQNMILAEKLYSQTALTEIASEAATMGYVPDGKILVLSGPAPVAYAQ